MSKQEQNFRHIFIGGHRRSGTSLFAAALGNHPEIFQYPDDSKFFQHVYHAAISGDRSATLDGLRIMLDYLYEVLSKYGFRPRVDLEDLYRVIASKITCPIRWDDVYRMLVGEVRKLLAPEGECENQSWLLQKTTSSEIYASSILSRFPDSTLFCVVRDPRDNFASLLRGFDSKYQYFKDSRTRQHLLFSLLSRGYCGVRSAVVNSKLFEPRQFFTIRYEDLVKKPRAVLEECCDILSLGFSEATLAPSIVGRAWKSNSFSPGITSPFDACRMGSWEQLLMPNEVALIEGWYGEEVFDFFRYTRTSSPNEISNALAEYYLWFNHQSELYSK